MHLEKHRLIWLACRERLEIYLGKPAHGFATGVAKVIFIDHSEEDRENAIDFHFGKSHTEARMPTCLLAHGPKLYLLILSPFGKMSGRIPLLRGGLDSGIVVNRPR